MQLTNDQLEMINQLVEDQDARVVDHPDARYDSLIIELYVGRLGHEHTRYHIGADGNVFLMETDPDDTGDWR